MLILNKKLQYFLSLIIFLASIIIGETSNALHSAYKASSPVSDRTIKLEDFNESHIKQLRDSGPPPTEFLLPLNGHGFNITECDDNFDLKLTRAPYETGLNEILKLEKNGSTVKAIVAGSICVGIIWSDHKLEGGKEGDYNYFVHQKYKGKAYASKALGELVKEKRKIRLKIFPTHIGSIKTIAKTLTEGKGKIIARLDPEYPFKFPEKAISIDDLRDISNMAAEILKLSEYKESKSKAIRDMELDVANKESMLANSKAIDNMTLVNIMKCEKILNFFDEKDAMFKLFYIMQTIPLELEYII